MAMTPRSGNALVHASLHRAALAMATLLVSSCPLALAQNPPAPSPTLPAPAQEAPKAQSNAFSASKIHETLIAEATAGSEVSWARSTENHLAWVEKANGKKTVRLDGKQIGASYEDVKYVAHSADEQHLVYFGKRNKKWVMVLDDKESGPEMDECYTWEFTRDGKRIAAAALLKRHWSWIVDGVPGPAFDVIGSIEFSPDGLHFAYGGADEKTGLGKHATHGALVVDGQIAQTYDGSGFGGGWAGVFGPQESMVTGVRSLSPDFHGVSDPLYTSE